MLVVLVWWSVVGSFELMYFFVVCCRTLATGLFMILFFFFSFFLFFFFSFFLFFLFMILFIIPFHICSLNTQCFLSLFCHLRPGGKCTIMLVDSYLFLKRKKKKNSQKKNLYYPLLLFLSLSLSLSFSYINSSQSSFLYKLP